MRIENFSSEALKLFRETVEKNGKKERTEVTKDKAEKAISVEISSELKGLSPEEVAREKVEAIKKALKEGKYQVNPHRITEAILKEFLGE
ncbi:MAG: flagellar biosynthesis anti-sigma factor FlgM [Desulfurobacteriaceae bacterium]